MFRSCLTSVDWLFVQYLSKIARRQAFHIFLNASCVGHQRGWGALLTLLIPWNDMLCFMKLYAAIERWHRWIWEYICVRRKQTIDFPITIGIAHKLSLTLRKPPGLTVYCLYYSPLSLFILPACPAHYVFHIPVCWSSVFSFLGMCTDQTLLCFRCAIHVKSFCARVVVSDYILAHFCD